MTAAPFILCASWCAASAGAVLPPPGNATVSVGGGMAVVVPTVGVAGTVGVTSWLAVAGRYETFAGLAHTGQASARARFADGWAIDLGVGYGLFVTDVVFGIDTRESPFGRGLRLEPSLHRSLRSGGVHVGIGAGATWRFDGIASAQAEVSFDWRAGAFLRVRGLVPLEGDFRVLGYLPTVVAGWSFAL